MTTAYDRMKSRGKKRGKNSSTILILSIFGGSAFALVAVVFIAYSFMPESEPTSLKPERTQYRFLKRIKAEPTLSNYDRVKVGMSTDEVIGILGPDYERKGLEIEMAGFDQYTMIWSSEQAGMMTVTIQNGIVAAKVRVDF